MSGLPGQLITLADVPRLQDLGKEHIYVWESVRDIVHEDEAALRLARHIAGPGLSWSEPNQGRVSLQAQHDGLLKVRTDQLSQINNLDDVIVATLHNNRVVRKGQTVAGTRIIPLTVERSILEEAENICCQPPVPLLTVKPFNHYGGDNNHRGGCIKGEFRTDFPGFCGGRRFLSGRGCWDR